MKKIAFIVEPNFNVNHFGVRNYFVTIKSILSDDYLTEFVSYANNGGQYLWYKITVYNEKENQKDDTALVFTKGSNSELNYNDILKFNRKNSGRRANYYFQSIGQTLENEEYDMAIITNPWLVSEGLKIKANVVAGIVHDFVANTYVFLNKEKPFDWANCHRVGYDYYNEYCDFIFCNTPSTAQQYKEYFPNIDHTKIKFFDPLVTDQFRKVRFEKKQKEKSIILAAPFDLRKGLKKMPEILNGIVSDVETLYIFGAPRCRMEDFDEFFHKLVLKHIVYYPYITYEGAIDLYSKSRVMLFPSFEEGLGIPLMEAQVCGCRVVTTNRAPMNQLTLAGSYLLTEDLTEDIQKISFMMQEDDFDYYSLSQQANNNFAGKGIKSFIDNCMV